MKKDNALAVLVLVLAIAAVVYWRPSLKITTSSLVKNSTETISSLEFRNLDTTKQTEIIKSLAENNPGQAWRFLKESFMIDGQAVGNAHGFAHIIGNKSYEKSGLEGIKICDDTFAFGCFHGVTEAMLLKQGVKKVKLIQDGCLKLFPPELSQDYTGCIHGTGHGLYGWEDGNLNKALGDCDALDEMYRQYCYDGVFMENSSAPANRVFKPEDPWKLCSILDERYHRNCARYQSQIFLGSSRAANSIKTAGKYCSMGPSAILKETCYESLGYYVAQGALGDSTKIGDSCSQILEKDGVEICIRGGAIETVFQRYSGFAVTSVALCRKLSEPRSSACLSNVNNMMHQNVVKK